ncbi:MAG: peptidoglycan binding domain-containing protein [Anaerolineae bacterium]|nr:peptidoglycan binding domain-containing protein [Anaerolineae bacterium]
MSDIIFQHHSPEGSFTQHQPHRRAVPARRRQRYTLRSIIIGMIAGLAVSTMLFGMIVVGGYGYFQILGLILPGVHVGSVQLGGMTTGRAAAKINATWNNQTEIVIAVEDQEWKAPFSDFGIALDAMATAQRAANVGHNETIPVEMADTLRSILRGWPIEPVVTLDAEVARAGLTKWAETINVPPVDASLQLQGGEVVAIPGRTGYTLDVEASLAALSTDPGFLLKQGYLPLVLAPIAPRVADVSAGVEEAKKLLATPLQVTVYDAITDESIAFSVEPEQIADWLVVESTDNGPHVVVDDAKTITYLSEIDETLSDGRFIDPERNAGAISQALLTGQPAWLVLSHPATIYDVQRGDTLTSIAWDQGIPLWLIMGANPNLDFNALDYGQTVSIPSRDVLMPLPIIPGKRIVLSITDQHLWAYENGSEVYSYVISTGIDRSPTQPGVFQVQTHELNAYASIWNLYMPHFMGIYQASSDFWNGFHGLPTAVSGNVLMWADQLGRKASYGCIILDLDNAETLYNWAEDGVVVEIRE